MTLPTDREIIELIEGKLPEELSADEAGRLRDWLVGSPNLHEWLLAQPKVVTYLDEALARIGTTLDEVFACPAPVAPARTAPASPRSVHGFRWFLAGVAIGLTCVFAFVRGVVYPWACEKLAGRNGDPPAAVALLDRLGLTDSRGPTGLDGGPKAPEVGREQPGDLPPPEPAGPQPPDVPAPIDKPAAEEPQPEQAIEQMPRGDARVTVDEASHPIAHEWSKEGYNLWTEIKAGLDQQAWDDVAQLVHDAAAGVDRGLVADYNDPQLLVPYGTMLALLVEDYPQVEEALRRRFGQRAALRLGAAAAVGDTAEVEAVAVGLWGTDASVEAYGWLGDRALARGDFTLALDHFHQALRGASPAARGLIEARARLAAALAGRDLGEPVSANVQYGGARLTARQFEGLVQDLIARRESRGFGADPDGLAAPEVPPAPPPGRYEARRFSPAQFAAEESSGPGRAALKAGWMGPSPSMTFDAGLLFATDGASLAAIAPASGDRAWSADLGVSQRSGRKAIPCRPVAAAGRVFVRAATEQGLVLRCFDGAKGSLLWTTDPARYVISDAFARGDCVLALALTPHRLKKLSAQLPARPPFRGAERPSRRSEFGSDTFTLSLAAFDAGSGRVRNESRLLALADGGKYAIFYQAVAAGESIVTTLPGGVLATGPSGDVRWVRRTPWTDGALLRPAARPLVAGRRAFVAVPAQGAVLGLDLDTGRQLWETPLTAFARLVGLAGEHLIAEDEAGLAALDPSSGEILWRHALADPVEGIACGGPGALMYCRIDRTDPKRPCPELVWVDPATGLAGATCPLASLASDRRTAQAFAPGPVITAGGRVFLGHRQPSSGSKTKELVELVRIEDRL